MAQRKAFALRVQQQSEHSIQSDVFRWAALAACAHPELVTLYAVPNGFHAANKRAAIRMLREGLRPSIPDVCLPVKRATFGALYIEHKTLTNPVSEKQQRMHDLLREQGNAVVVSRSFEHSRTALLAYLDRGECVASQPITRPAARLSNRPAPPGMTPPPAHAGRSPLATIARDE